MLTSNSSCISLFTNFTCMKKLLVEREIRVVVLTSHMKEYDVKYMSTTTYETRDNNCNWHTYVGCIIFNSSHALKHKCSLTSLSAKLSMSKLWPTLIWYLIYFISHWNDVCYHPR